MTRWDPLEPSHPTRGAGRRRSFPLGPIDVVPGHLIEAAKRIFVDYWAAKRQVAQLDDVSAGTSY